MEDTDETIVVKASYEGNDLASATIAVDDRVLPVTAAEVMDRESLMGFVEGAKEHFQGFTSADDAANLISDLRNEGDFNSGDTFLIIFLPNGAVFLHGGDPSRDGINASELEDDNGVMVVQNLLEAAAAGGDFVDYTWDDPEEEGDDPARVAYATSVSGNLSEQVWVLVGGFVQDIPDEEITDLPDPPEVWARDVVDKKTLKAFVQGAARWSEDALAAVGLSNLSKVKEILREEGGPWKSGAVYLFAMTANGYVFFHGADVNQEGKIQTHLEDLNGVRFVEKLIEAALAGGDFVEYYYDDPSVEGDEELGSPKVSYAEAIIVPELFPGVPIVFGAGFYRRPVDDVPEITLEVDPETVFEGSSGQEVTVTATLTDDPVSVATIIDLALEGTATSEDYTTDGTLEIVIPADSTSASTALTFDVEDDGMEDADETIVVKAGYEGNDLTSATITVKDAFRAPQVTGSLPEITLEAGDSETLNLGSVFGGTSLSLAASSSDNNIATAVVSAATLTVTAVGKGSATVMVTANNSAGSASVSTSVTVTAVDAERMAYENILAAMGRSMLSSVSTTIGGRFSGGSGRGVAVGGRRIDGLASGISALAGLTGHRRQASSKHLALMDDSEHRRSLDSGYLLRSSSFSYALEDHTSTGGLRWAVWGAGDWQNFQGEPEADASYDGSLKTAYVGVDMATQGSWLAGIALSHSLGQSDYDVTVASGSLETSLTSVLPYLRWSSNGCCTEVWSILGLGTGEVEVADASSDLSMRMGMVGMRSRLASSGGLGLDVVGDAGLLRLSTSDSESASLSDIAGDAQRVRIGLEGSRSSTLRGGTTVTPYAQVAGRYDGGNGQTGQGLEVSGGLRLSGNRIGINAQGRFLAVHSAEGYKENGISLVAYLRPGGGSQGLSMSVAPRIGAATGDSGMMWRERPLSGASINGGRDARALKAEVGYGLAYPSMGLLMTPFGEMYLAGDDRRQMRLGARFGGVENNSRKVSLELSGMRVDRRGGESDHRLGLIGRMSF